MLGNILSTKHDRYVSSDLSILLLRVGAGVLILTHGIPKLMNVLAGNFGFGDPIGIGPAASLVLATFAEAICGFLVLLGLGTRIASFVLIINMSVAALIAHAGDPFGIKEKAVLFLLLFIVIALTGGGKYSIDQKLSLNSK